jgi:WD40 repeat protein
MRLWNIDTAQALNDVAVAQPKDADIWKVENQEDLTASEIERNKRQSMSAIAIDQSGLQAVPRVVAVTEDNRVRMWDIADDQLQPSGDDDNVVADLNVYKGIVWSATFVRTALPDDATAPDGAAARDDVVAGAAKTDYLLTVGGEEARLWDLESHQPKMSFGRQGAVASARFSPTDPRVVTASWDNAARIWNADSGKAGRKLQGGHDAFVNSAVYSPDGTKIVTASDDDTMTIWNAVTGDIVRELKGHTGNVRMAVFSPNDGGARVLSASDDKTARIWDARTGECLVTLAGHKQAVLAAAFSPKGDLVVTASEDNTARLWDAVTGEPILKPEDVGEGADADGGALDGPDAAADGPVHNVSLPMEEIADGQPGSNPAVAAVGPDAADETDPAEDARPDDGDNGDGEEEEERTLLLEGHTAAVTAVIFSPTGSRVVTASADSTAKIWDTKTGNEILTLRGHSRELTTVSFAPDGKSILTGSRDGTCILWLATEWGAGEDEGGQEPAVAMSGASE